MMDWWNPCAKSFREVMGKRGKETPASKNTIYGILREMEKESFLPAPMV
jgi:hypothetical protein